MDWLDLLVSLLVLVAVSLASEHGSTLVAAVAATAPTGLPLSLWLVLQAAARSAAPAQAQAAQVDSFLVAATKGTLCACAFCLGALGYLRSQQHGGGGQTGGGAGGGGVEVGLLGALLLAGYGCWGAAWLALHSLRF